MCGRFSQASSELALVRVPHDHAGGGNYPLKMELVNSSLSPPAASRQHCFASADNGMVFSTG